MVRYGGVSESDALVVAPPAEKVSVNGVVVATEAVVMVYITLFNPAGTRIGATEASAGLLLVTVTSVPPTGAGPVRLM